ncbi:DUF2239 family protein [Alcaligenes nematophilus]|uniref:DUF2239 family protein n=1 Tax=Alcaligenes nematophilus TaxID=2994643 RepID=A0ABU3MTG6_9BURK|nr:DUF2239 family protein [Alcaligenes nematophilus]MDT8464646.1 DUF2239 family protein [Alcaligenes nematophilus]MDT8467454.1 DUF2239 family protein [Alcaligenes nematophilus]MDT8503930.1 DUF2239 family protein [Alcaligenes nematophilus]MDT8523813.1 DUF2239 family protein [Alcaligenes nematophilus]
MKTTYPNTYTSFMGHRRIASGPMLTNVLAVKKVLESRVNDPVLIFDDVTGRFVDVNTQGTDEELAQRYAPVDAPEVEVEQTEEEAPRGRGRPKLGVVPREVTLLPRHWDWLATQPGGASVALRKLVEEARRASAVKDQRRQAQERAYNFMTAIGGDLPGFEEAMRALFADELERFKTLLAGWPEDVREHAIKLAETPVTLSA